MLQRSVLLDAFSVVPQNHQHGHMARLKHGLQLAIDQTPAVQLQQAFGSMTHAAASARSQHHGTHAWQGSVLACGGGQHFRVQGCL
jgi:hypothetical protein